MRIEKNGFALYLEGTWMEISNRYGVLEHGDVATNEDNIPEGFAETELDRFIETHSIKDMETPTCIKKVAFDPETAHYIQLQAVLPVGSDTWDVQRYDDELVYMGETRTGCKHLDEVMEWMRRNYQIESGLPAEVYRSPNGDCTNGGISSTRRTLYIMTKREYPFEPSDLRECVSIGLIDYSTGEIYTSAMPLYFPRRWYMAGGNFLYTSDSRYREITGISYPVPIHDRYEGR